jgi:hypothetical protein
MPGEVALDNLETPLAAKGTAADDRNDIRHSTPRSPDHPADPRMHRQVVGAVVTLRVLAPPRKRGLMERFVLWLFSRPARRPW